MNLPPFPDPDMQPDTQLDSGLYSGSDTDLTTDKNRLLAGILALLASSPLPRPEGPDQKKDGETAKIMLDSLSFRPVPPTSLPTEKGKEFHAYFVLETTAEQAGLLASRRHYAEEQLLKQTELANLLQGMLTNSLRQTSHPQDSSPHTKTSQDDVFQGENFQIVQVHISFAATRPSAPVSPTRPKEQIATRNKGHRPFALGQAAQNSQHAAESVSEALLPDVRAVIAVSSGKGGVGKSTIAVNLACGLAQLGFATGLLDADIYGPSLPHMLGVHVRPEVTNGRLRPLKAWGLETMSIGYLVDDRQAMIWRGPMIMGALGQFMRDVAWGRLDILIVDMPPGTGDAQLTLTQKLGDKLEQGGAVIVSTPQDIALLDARRGVGLFEKARVPLLGMVENMSWFCCPHCHERTDIFGHGGAQREAAALSLPFLGEIPLLSDIRLHADSGTPILLSAPESDAARAYQALSRNVANKLTAKWGVTLAEYSRKTAQS